MKPVTLIEDTFASVDAHLWCTSLCEFQSPAVEPPVAGFISTTGGGAPPFGVSNERRWGEGGW